MEISTAFKICVPVSNIKHFGKLRKLHSDRGSTNALFSLIGHVNEYPTMHYFGNPRHTQSMIAYIILTEYFWKFQWKITFGMLLTCPIKLQILLMEAKIFSSNVWFHHDITVPLHKPSMSNTIRTQKENCSVLVV